MSSEEYIEHVREARKRKSVLKIKVLAIRSGDSEIPIFVFEGKTDIGPYEAWVKRINSELFYKGIPAEGKAQVLEFRDSISEINDEQLSSIYFFVDNDYDGLRGCQESSDLYCTDSYSFENYLATNEVLISILEDELGCVADFQDVERSVQLYEKVSHEFCEAMSQVNFRLFLAAKYDLGRGRLDNRINSFVTLSLDNVRKNYCEAKLKNLIPLLDEADECQVARASEEFSGVLEPMMSSRGKYVLSFFLAWLDKLAEARRAGAFPFSEASKIKYNRASMSERSLASRSPIPSGLSDFILNIDREACS